MYIEDYQIGNNKKKESNTAQTIVRKVIRQSSIFAVTII